MKRSEIHLRDPFVLPVAAEQQYYLYGTNGPNPWDNSMGFDAYVSADLENWDGPLPVFRPPHGFWANCSFWAPEVFAHDGKYYMCASFTNTHWSKQRGTQILMSDSPRGPFVAHSDGPVTPAGDVCIDGTLFWDDDKQPWMIYCHERMQVIDGRMCAIALSTDLRESVGDKHDLFRASEGGWADAIDEDQYTTDGPFLYKTKTGRLFMIWSSFHQGKYAMGVARSVTGNIRGPWAHDPKPLFSEDGGHGMIFRTFQGETVLSFHTPGMTFGKERTVFRSVTEQDGELRLRQSAEARIATQPIIENRVEITAHSPPLTLHYRREIRPVV